MRRRLVISTIAIVLVVMGALAVPVAKTVFDAAEAQLNVRLEQQAKSLVEAWDRSLATGDSLSDGELLNLISSGDGLVVVGNDGEARAVQDLADNTSSVRFVERQAGDDTNFILSTAADPLNDDLRRQFRILLILALGAIVAAAGLAAVQARQLARPLERLALRAGRIGDGDFSRQPFVQTHIPEIDHIGSSLDLSAMRVETMLANERHFTADATHQLRTGIAGIAMRLELLSLHPDPLVATDAAEGLRQTDQLNATIDDLLAAARNRTTNEREVFDLGAIVNDHADEWQPRFQAVRRHISVITSKPAPPVFGTKGLTGQVLDILIDNALKHGSGAVTLMIDGPSVVVIDQGPGMTKERLSSVFDGPVDPSAKHGRGLALARRLAQVDGGTLSVVGNNPLRLRLELVRGDIGPVAG
jgi:signal transduction histidine kinase